MKQLDEILEEVLSEMTDEEFDEAWQKTKERVIIDVTAQDNPCYEY